MSIQNTQLSHYLSQASRTTKQVIAKHPIPCAIIAICGAGAVALTIHKLMSPSFAVNVSQASVSEVVAVDLNDPEHISQLANLFLPKDVNERHKKGIIECITNISLEERANIPHIKPFIDPYKSNMAAGDKKMLITWVSQLPKEHLQYIPDAKKSFKGNPLDPQAIKEHFQKFVTEQINAKINASASKSIKN